MPETYSCFVLMSAINDHWSCKCTILCGDHKQT